MVNQQICISNNLDKMKSFFSTESGKTAVSMFAEEFTNYVK